MGRVDIKVRFVSGEYEIFVLMLYMCVFMFFNMYEILIIKDILDFIGMIGDEFKGCL